MWRSGLPSDKLEGLGCAVAPASRQSIAQPVLIACLWHIGNNSMNKGSLSGLPRSARLNHREACVEQQMVLYESAMDHGHLTILGSCS